MLLLRLPRIGFLENSMKPTIPEVSKARQLPTLYKGPVLNPLSSVLVDANGAMAYAASANLSFVLG